MNIRNLFILTAFIFTTSFLSHAKTTSDSERIKDVKLQLVQSQEMLSKIEERMKDPDITDNELSIFRQKLKETDNSFISEAEYFRRKLNNDKAIIADLSGLGLNDNTLKEDADDILSSKVNAIYAEIGEYSSILIQLRLFTGQISDMIHAISDKKIKIRSKDLFVYNLPFYRAEAWTSGKKDIATYLESMVKAFPSFKGSILRAGWNISFLFILVLVGLISFISYRLSSKFKKIIFSKPIKTGHLEITKYRDIFQTRWFITLMIFLKNAVVPSLLLLMVEHSFYMNYGYGSTNKWFFLLWNITTTLVFIFSLHTIVNIFFDKRLGFLHETFTDSRKFKRRCVIIVYQVALLFTMNDIDVMDISISINPILSINGTALLNLILGLTISYNIFILAPKIKQYFLHLDSKTQHVSFYLWIINFSILVALATPAMVFMGASNFFIGLSLNLTQCFLIIFFFCVVYGILKNIHPILSRSIVEFFYRASAESGEDEEKFSHIDHKTPIFTYWLNFLILTFFSTITAILFLLIWGVPPDVVVDWTNTILFKGIPLGEHSTFPLSYLFRAIVCSIVVYYLFKGIQNLAENKILPYTSMDNGSQKAVITTIGYMGIVLSVAIFVYALGINLTALTFIISGLSVGIGFALQEFFKNFFSGFVLLIERPIKVGDLLMYKNDLAEVKKIRVRSTELLTFSRVTLIVPNSELVNNTVVNETISSTTCIMLKMGVAYEADPDIVIPILTDAAISTEDIFAKPPPLVEVYDFADSAIIYNIKAYTKRSIKMQVTSMLRRNIYAKLKEANIEIPFPQRTIHIKNIANAIPIDKKTP